MKSQPEIKIRRLAVFGGYGDLEAGTVWSRHAQLPTAEPPATRPQDPRVMQAIQLGARPRPVDLPVAA